MSNIISSSSSSASAPASQGAASAGTVGTAAAAVISTILKHDRKITSYKIALLRSINDVVLYYPDLGSRSSQQHEQRHQDVAIPLRVLASHWLGYYWCFCDPLNPIYQGQRSNRNSRCTAAAPDAPAPGPFVSFKSPPPNPLALAPQQNLSLLHQNSTSIIEEVETTTADLSTATLMHDMDFRPYLTRLRLEWLKAAGGNKSSTRPSDGFFLVNEMQLSRKRDNYPPSLLAAYNQTIKVIAKTIENPIQYAGPGQWSVFKKPVKFSQLVPEYTGGSQSQGGITVLPGTLPEDKCLVVSGELWQTFQEMSLWVEALCLHEWCLFSERMQKSAGSSLDRGDIYRLLTDRPDNRRPLTWERNQIDLLLMEGKQFTCPWTRKVICRGVKYDLDHLLPLAVYPTNELWNLVPADPDFNSRIKRDRLPSAARLAAATQPLTLAYTHYYTAASKSLAVAIEEDSAVRFSGVNSGRGGGNFPKNLALAVTNFIAEVTQVRNIAVF